MTMEKSTQAGLDHILEAEIAAGFRIKELPENLQAQLKMHGQEPFTSFRLTRLNPSRKKKLYAAVQGNYFKDLQNKELLSNAQIIELVKDRGEWSVEKDVRIQELRDATNAAMAELWRDGFVQDTGVWMEQLTAQRKIIEEQLEKSELTSAAKAEYNAVFSRWLEYSPESKELYNAAFASTQGPDRTVYSHEADSQWLTDKLPALEVVDAIAEIEELLDKVQQFVQLVKDRQELNELEGKRLSIFADSVESRKEIAEEMARLYFTTEKLLDGKPNGPLTATFDALWELPQDVIDHLLSESFFFANGIPDEAREYLSAYGFLRGGVKQSTDSEASAESPALPSSNPDSPAATETVESSSAPKTATPLTTPN